MFISNEEKINIKSELGLARSQISGLISAVSALTDRVNDLERAATKPSKVKKPKKALTPEQKAKQREYQKMYKARKKQEALANQGNANVSA
jgi:hypothetical protein